jgi:hypothetical protein
MTSTHGQGPPARPAVEKTCFRHRISNGSSKLADLPLT